MDPSYLETRWINLSVWLSKSRMLESVPIMTIFRLVTVQKSHATDPKEAENTREDVSLTQPQVGALSQQAVSIVNGVEPSLEDGHEITMGENQIVSQTIDSCATFCPQPSTSTSQEVTILFNIYRLITVN